MKTATCFLIALFAATTFAHARPPLNKNIPVYNTTTKVTVTFESKNAECSLNGSNFVSCTSPLQLGNQTLKHLLPRLDNETLKGLQLGVADGRHELKVRDALSKKIIEQRIFDIDTTSPVLTLLEVPKERISSTGTSVFKFTANEPIKARCYLDQKAYEPCEANKELSIKLDGRKDPYEFKVMGADLVGNESVSQSYKWQVVEPADSAGTSSGSKTQ